MFNFRKGSKEIQSKQDPKKIVPTVLKDRSLSGQIELAVDINPNESLWTGFKIIDWAGKTNISLVTFL